MGWYARTPRRLAAQVAADAFVLAWALGWWLAGRATDAAVRAIAAPAREASALGEQAQGHLATAAEQAGTLPFVGDGLRAPLLDLAGEIAAMTDYAHQQVAAVEATASLLGWLVFLIPVLGLVAAWLPRRWAFVAGAREARALAASPEGLDLLALRALVHQPPARLRTIADAPLAAWRSGDRAAVARLAALELERAGVRSGRRPDAPQ